MRVLCAYQLGSQINLFDLNIQLDWMSAFEDLKTYYTRQKNPQNDTFVVPGRFRRQTTPGKKNTVRCGLENSLHPKNQEMK